MGKNLVLNILFFFHTFFAWSNMYIKGKWNNLSVFYKNIPFSVFIRTSVSITAFKYILISMSLNSCDGERKIRILFTHCYVLWQMHKKANILTSVKQVYNISEKSLSWVYVPFPSHAERRHGYPRDLASRAWSIGDNGVLVQALHIFQQLE